MALVQSRTIENLQVLNDGNNIVCSVEVTGITHLIYSINKWEILEDLRINSTNNQLSTWMVVLNTLGNCS